MKTLPDRPNMDHLRQQAKDQHRRLRRDDPEATLSAAQAAVARQYGFDTWTALKAEVDQRLGSVSQADAELTAALAQCFGLGRPLTPMTGVDRGPMERSWQLDTDRARWLLVQEIDWSPWDDVSDELRLVEAALEAGVDADRPVRSPAGNAVETVNGTKWRAFEWLDTGPPPPEPVAPRVAAGVGTIVGRLHALALTTDTPITPWLLWRRPDDDWRALLDRAQQTAVPWADELAATLPQLLEVNALPVPDPKPTSVLTHRNVNLGSIRLLGARGLYVGCWQHAGPLPPSWELATVLAEWTGAPDGSSDPDLVRAVVDGYRSSAGDVPRLEIDDFAAAISGILNWTSTRISIALDPEEPGEQRQMATAEVPGLLAGALSIARLEALMAATR